MRPHGMVDVGPEWDWARASVPAHRTVDGPDESEAPEGAETPAAPCAAPGPRAPPLGPWGHRHAGQTYRACRVDAVPIGLL